MYDRAANENGSICYRTFDKTDEPFFGFPDDDSTPEAHYNLFQKVRKYYLSPVVVIDRMRGNWSRGGRVGRKVGNGSVVQRQLSKVPRILGDEFGTKPSRTKARLAGKPVAEVDFQLCSSEKFWENLECNVAPRVAPNVSNELTVEEEDEVQAHLCEVQPEALMKLSRRRPRPSDRSGVKASERMNSLLGNNVETKHAMRYDKSAKEIELDPVRDNNSEISFGGSKRCSSLDKRECNGSDMELCDSPLTVDSEVFDENYINRTASTMIHAVQLSSSVEHSESGAEENSDSHPTSEDSFELCDYQDEIGSNGSNNDVRDLFMRVPHETIGSSDLRDLPHSPAGRLDEPIVDIESHLDDISQDSEDGPEHGACRGEIECYGSDMDICDSPVNVLDEVTVDKDAKGSKCSKSKDLVEGIAGKFSHVEPKHALGAAKRCSKTDAEVQPQVSVDGFQASVEDHLHCSYQDEMCGNVSCKDVNGSVLPAPNAVIVAEEEDISTKFPAPSAVTVDSQLFNPGGSLILENNRDGPDVAVPEDMQYDQSFRYKVAENLHSSPSCKSIEEPQNHRTRKILGNLCSSERVSVHHGWDSVRMLKPCVVRLERVPEIEKIVRSANYGTTRYPVVVVRGHRMSAGVRKRRRSFSLQQKCGVDGKARKKKREPNPHAGQTQGLTSIDLSDGLTLKKFCELKSVSLTDSSSDEESSALEPRASSILPHYRKNPASSPSPQKLSKREVLPFRSNVESDYSTPPHEELEPSSDSLVSENPVPSGVQALNELGFLEHESFQFGKDHTSGNIWGDVLESGETEESHTAAAPQTDPRASGKLSYRNSGKKTSVSAEVNFHKKFSKSDVDSTNIKPGGKRGLSESFYDDVLDSTPSGNEDGEESDSKSLNSVAKMAGSKFAASLNTCGKLPFRFARNWRREGKIETERQLEYPTKPCRSSDSTSADDTLMDSDDDDDEEPRSGKTRVNSAESVGESEFLASLIRPAETMEDLCKRQRKGVVDKEWKRRCLDGPSQTEDYEKAPHRPGGKNTKMKKLSSRGLSDVGGTQRLSPSQSKALKTSSKNHRNTGCGSENVTEESLEAERASRELKYRLSTSWLTKKFEAKKESSDVGGDVKIEESDAKEEVPTSEKLYSDLATIPYILKCNLQNKSRKCKNLNPCASANKKFQLFFTLTVGVGRRLSKPLLETFRGGDGCKINKTAAFIAASAVAFNPTTVLVPACPELVRKLLPTYHSSLLMQLVGETQEMEKQEKKSMSDMAIAETLQFKRALIAMKSRYSTTENKDPLQSMQSKPESDSIILQLLRLKNPFMYKSNKIVAMKSKVDNKSRFLGKSLVSILPKDPNKGVLHPAGDEDRRTDSAETQLGSQGGRVASGSSAFEDNTTSDLKPEVFAAKETSGNGSDPATQPLLLRGMLLQSSSDPGRQRNDINGCSPKVSESATSNENDKSIKPVTKKLIPGSPCNVLSSLDSNNPEIVPQILKAFSLGDTASDSSDRCASDIGSSQTGHTQIVDNQRCSPEPVGLPGGSERHFSQVEKSSLVPVCSRDPESSSSKKPLQSADRASVIERSGSQLQITLPSTTIQKNRKQPTSSDLIQKSFKPAREDTPDVILVREEIESIDLTSGEEESTGRNNNPYSKWAVMCPTLPELGFIGVQKVVGKLMISDKAVVPGPLECDSLQELRKFLNARLADLAIFRRSNLEKTKFEWILVTSSYLLSKNIPRTNPLFWLPPYTAWKTLTEMRNSQLYGMPSINPSTPEVVSAQNYYRSKAQTPKGQTKVGPASRSRSAKNGKVVRINGQTVVMGTPANYLKLQKGTPDLSSSSGQAASSVVSSTSSVKPHSGTNPELTPVTRTITRPSSGPRTLPPHLEYTNSVDGYVPLLRKASYSVVKTKSPASSVKSGSVSNLPCSPRLLKLPATKPSTSVPTSVLLTRQQTTANSLVSAGSSDAQIPASGARVASVPSGNQNGTSSKATRIIKTTTVRAPLTCSASRIQTTISFHSPRVSQTTTVRAANQTTPVSAPIMTQTVHVPFASSSGQPCKQKVAKPGSIRYVSLASIVPRSVPVQCGNAPLKTSDPTSDSEKPASSPKPLANSTSTAVSQKFVEALTRQPSRKPYNRSVHLKNRPIIILRKGSAGIDGKSNQIKFVFQKP